MTAIYYSDCRATSPYGAFVLEARSPHNGTIPYRNGRPADPEDFPVKYRQHQSQFRYQLLGSGHVIWERWQPANEDSPHEVVVADDGWSVLRTHGFCPDVIAVSPEGRDVVRARIWYADNPDLKRGPPPTHVWHPAQTAFTSAGIYWTENAWRYFVSIRDRPHFVWRLWHGQRLVIDLERAFVYPDDQPLPDGMEPILVDTERRGVTEFLSRLAPRMDEIRDWFQDRLAGEEAQQGDPLINPLRQVKAAFHLVGVHRIAECVPFLRAWEVIDCPSIGTMSFAIPTGWLEVQAYRPIIQHALRLLREEPAGFAPYYFTDSFGKIGGRRPVPERLPDRRARAARLHSAMLPGQVLELLGSPDHVRREPRDAGEPVLWTETWDYDFRGRAHWLTIRITWAEQGAHRSVRMTGLKQLEPDYLMAAGREADILRH